MSIRRHIAYLAILGIAAPISFGAPVEASAQQFITQQQIIQNLRRRPIQVAPGQQQMILQQQGAPRVVLRRAPGAVPPSTAMMRVPEPVDHSGQVAVRRAPMPQGGNVAEFRAPPPQGFDVQEFRAPPPRGKKPPRNSDGIQVANNDKRGLDIRPANGNRPADTHYPDNARVDLEILFDYNSARIDPGSVKQLIVLGEALNDPELANARIVVAGHTDAAGSDAYNSDLSLRRARAVYDFLVDYAGIDASRLIPEGYGERLLKYPDAPQSGQNRRVEIINLGEAS